VGKRNRFIVCGSVAGKTGEREREMYMAAMRRTRQVVGF
jgi:hypothetical protein